MQQKLSIFALVIAVVFSVSAPTQHVDAVAYSRVFVNGVPVPVTFNDGDSFRIHGGEYRGRQCRLAGFNTLESYGPCHQWGDWHPYELYINAKQATLNGRRGVWHCTTDGSIDGYGRLLVDCPDLAFDQIRRGLAHAMNIDDTPSRPEYLRAQQEAVTARRGMWAHGVPDYVATSLHSASENPSRASHYNRLVSVRDGHSESRQHNETYSECEWVCNEELRIDLPIIEAAAERLRADPEIAPLITEFFNLHLVEFVSRFRRLGELPEYLPEGRARDLIRARLERELAAGELGETRTERGACVLYAEFERRYGRNRAACLRDHGTVPPHVSGGH